MLTFAIRPQAGRRVRLQKNVQDARHRLWQTMPRFVTLADLNDWLEQRCQALSREIPHGSEQGSIFDAWQSEVGCLMAVGRPFDGFVEYGKRVSPPASFTLIATATACPRPSPIIASA